MGQMTKWILMLILVLAFPLALLGCGSDATPDGDTPTGEEAKAGSAKSEIEATPSGRTSTGRESTDREPTATSISKASSNVHEYLTRIDCGAAQWQEDLEEVQTYGDAIELSREEIAVRSAILPPPELAEWHDYQLEVSRAIIALLEQQPPEDPIDDELMLQELESSLPDAPQQLDAIMVKLSDGTIWAMLETGCLTDYEARYTPDRYAGDFQNATPIDTSDGIAGTLRPDDTDMFVFEAEAGYEYDVYLSYDGLFAEDPSTSPIISVYNADGRLVAVFDEYEGEIELQPEEDAKYYVELGDGASRGHYVLRVSRWEISEPAPLPTPPPPPGRPIREPAGEYLAICGLAEEAIGDSNSMGDSFDLKELVARYEDVIELFESVEPPEEFAGWHEAMLVYLKALVQKANDAPGEGASGEETEDYALRTLGPLASQHLPVIFGIIEGMAPEDIARMVEAGCVDEGDIDMFSAGEGSTEPGRGEGTTAVVTAVSTGMFTSASTGWFHTCGIKTDGLVECWGFNEDFEGAEVGQATPPDGEFSSVSAGALHTCGIRTDGSLACWGSNEDAEGNKTGQATPPSGEFSFVSAGDFHTCGISRDGLVICWGSNEDYEGIDVGQARPPSGEFVSVSAGAEHSCGIRTDGSPACWGSDIAGQATPPSGEFVEISAGFSHTCGVRSNGSVRCWGHDGDGRATQPDGEFVSVSAGDFHTCGVRSNGSVECWGSNEGLGGETGQAMSPDGEFTSVGTGSYHNCGLRRDGFVECWGSDEYGQSTPP